VTKKFEVVTLGDRVRDAISGYEGIATGHAAYLYGCSQILICPEHPTKEGGVRESLWFDEQRVALVKRSQAPQLAPHVEAGGPQEHAPRGRR